MPKPIEADLVILDFDDTLTMTHGYVFTMENEIAVAMGLPPISKEDHLKTWGQSLADAVPARYSGIDLDEHIRRRPAILARMIQTGEADQITPENLATLDELITRGKKLAILTSRTIEEATHLLDPNHVINQRIERFYHKGSSPFHKPNPRVFDQVLEDFRIPAHRAVYVGDAVSDAEAATKAGLSFIAVMESGHKKPEDFSRFRVNHFVDRFPGILKVVR